MTRDWCGIPRSIWDSYLLLEPKPPEGGSLRLWVPTLLIKISRSSEPWGTGVLSPQVCWDSMKDIPERLLDCFYSGTGFPVALFLCVLPTLFFKECIIIQLLRFQFPFFFIWVLLLLLLPSPLSDSVSLHRPGWLGTHYVSQAGPKCTEICLLLTVKSCSSTPGSHLVLLQVNCQFSHLWLHCHSLNSPNTTSISIVSRHLSFPMALLNCSQ